MPRGEAADDLDPIRRDRLRREAEERTELARVWREHKIPSCGGEFLRTGPVRRDPVSIEDDRSVKPLDQVADGLRRLRRPGEPGSDGEDVGPFDRLLESHVIEPFDVPISVGERNRDHFGERRFENRVQLRRCGEGDQPGTDPEGRPAAEDRRAGHPGSR